MQSLLIIAGKPTPFGVRPSYNCLALKVSQAFTLPVW
jgi:hypothetical protein